MTVMADISTFQPLKNKTFCGIWLAMQVSSLGWMMHTVAIGWIMASIAESETVVALVQTASTLPAFFLAFFAGAMADNFGRRIVLMAGWSLVLCAGAALSVALLLGVSSPWTFLSFSLLLGCGFALHGPAWAASVGDIVGTHELPAAVTLVNVGTNTTRSVGPAIGGALVALAGPVVALCISTISYLAPLTVIWLRKWNEPISALSRDRIGTALYDGARFTAISTEIKSAILRGGLFGLAGSSLLALLPLVVRDQLAGGPLTYGILMGGFGIGAFFGGMSAAVLRRAIEQELLVKLACVATAISLFVLPFAPTVYLGSISLVIGGIGWITAWSGFSISVQLASPRWIVGRTISIYHAASFGGIALGSWLWGSVAEERSLTVAYVASGVCMLLVAAAGKILPVSHNNEIDHDPVAESVLPNIAMDLAGQSGPIVAEIRYYIAAEDTDHFLVLMFKRRMSQQRVGVRNWTLTRDLNNPDLWTESFRTPTWSNYQRVNQRRTMADQALEAEINALSYRAQSDEPLRVQLSIERPTNKPRPLEPVAMFTPRI